MFSLCICICASGWLIVFSVPRLFYSLVVLVFHVFGMNVCPKMQTTIGLQKQLMRLGFMLLIWIYTFLSLRNQGYSCKVKFPDFLEMGCCFS